MAAKLAPRIATPIADAETPIRQAHGRPSSRDDETTEMLAIRAANPDRDEHYCRHLFEAALRQREAPLKEVRH